MLTLPCLMNFSAIAHHANIIYLCINKITTLVYYHCGNSKCHSREYKYWFARELQELPGYADWRNFLNAIDKLKESCKTTAEAVSDHFVDVNKMVKIGSGDERRPER